VIAPAVIEGQRDPSAAVARRGEQLFERNACEMLLQPGEQAAECGLTDAKLSTVRQGGCIIVGEYSVQHQNQPYTTELAPPAGAVELKPADCGFARFRRGHLAI